MNITLKGLKSLTSAELTFVIAMMQTYGDLNLEEVMASHNTKGNSRHKNKNKIKKPTKVIKNHNNCTKKTPCLYDFNCHGWKDCDDERFLQYRLIIKKCEK